MNIRELRLDELVLDEDLYLRDRLDDFTVERYADAWERMPPVTVYQVEGQYLLADGFHRHAAAVMLGRKKLPAEIREGTLQDALDFVSTVNLFHGLPLTRTERRRAVEVKLKLHPDWSDRRISEGMGVGRELIAKLRRQLVEAGQVPGDIGRVGSDGKTYTAGLPRDPNEHLPRGKDTGQDDEPKVLGKGKAADVPWDDTITPLPAPVGAGRPESKGASGDVGDKKIAQSGPIATAAPSIDEMLQLMASQVTEVVGWTQAEGFIDAYRQATGNARGVFQSAVIKLAARADQLRKT